MVSRSNRKGLPWCTQVQKDVDGLITSRGASSKPAYPESLVGWLLACLLACLVGWLVKWVGGPVLVAVLRPFFPCISQSKELCCQSPRSFGPLGFGSQCSSPRGRHVKSRALGFQSQLFLGKELSVEVEPPNSSKQALFSLRADLFSLLGLPTTSHASCNSVSTEPTTAGKAPDHAKSSFGFYPLEFSASHGLVLWFFVSTL